MTSPRIRSRVSAFILLSSIAGTIQHGHAFSLQKHHSMGLRSAPKHTQHEHMRTPQSLRMHRRWQPPRQVHKPLTTKGTSDDADPKVGILKKARQKFMARPVTYLIIPVIAAIVGWFTNYLAVQMIFYPVEYWGIPLYRRPEVPLGLVGWQGIVPCKTRTMTAAMCDMVTTQLLTVSDAFARLDPRKAAQLLAPKVPDLGLDIVSDVFPNSLTSWPVALLKRFSGGNQPFFLRSINTHFLTKIIRDMQLNIDSIFNLESCVINQMLLDRGKLGELFQSVAQKELDFLVNSGLWFGFLLGLIQMAVALVWENPWSLSIGGCIVGLATNWLALKWIFEPINPTRIGPFVLQGQFLRRQKEVAEAFSKFFADNILSSPRLWDSICTNPGTTPAFQSLLRGHFERICGILSFGLGRGSPAPGAVDAVTRSAIERLPSHVDGLHGYIDKTLGLEATLRTKMEAMSAAKFERVLHPIFEEDELTLILAGAALGLAAGLVQQGLETGAIRFRNPLPRIRRSLASAGRLLRAALARIRGRPRGSDGVDA